MYKPENANPQRFTSYVAPPQRDDAAQVELLQTLRAAEARGSATPCPPLVVRVNEGAAVHFEGARAESVHVVRSGAFKCVRVLEDGYEQVVSFAERGEVMGYDGLYRGEHVTTAIALEESTAYALPTRELDTLPVRWPELDRALRCAVSRELVDAGRTANMIAAVASETRLARFLVWYAERAAERGESPRRLRLRMGRREIASFLGMAHATVSRSFTLLADHGVLAVDNRDVEILDPVALIGCSRGTRRGVDERAQHPVALAMRPAAPALLRQWPLMAA